MCGELEGGAIHFESKILHLFARVLVARGAGCLLRPFHDAWPHMGHMREALCLNHVHTKHMGVIFFNETSKGRRIMMLHLFSSNKTFKIRSEFSHARSRRRSSSPLFLILGSLWFCALLVRHPPHLYEWEQEGQEVLN